ncbi:MAG: PilZ domain-containing protein [Treponema sp.]
MRSGLDFQAGKSPILSRQNPVIYTALLIGLIIIAAIFVVWSFLKRRKKFEQSEEFKEQEKRRMTKRRDVKVLSQRYAFSTDEETTLFHICRKYRIPNIVYSMQNPENLEPFFKSAYEDLRREHNEILINRLFNLKFRLDKIYAGTQIIENTRRLLPETAVFMNFTDGSRIECRLLENTKDSLVLQIPENYFASELRQKEFTKAVFSFVSKTELSYAFFARILRYEKSVSGIPCMLIAHSSELMKKVRHNYKRIDTESPCSFSAVKKRDVGKKAHYEPFGKRYDCTLTNISGGGCRLRSRLPIKEGQLICTHFNFDGREESAIGKIVKTRKSPDGKSYVLRIHFLEIPLELQNKILVRVYGYNDL